MDPDPRAVVGIRLKLRRAQSHLQRLDAEIGAYSTREPYAVMGEFSLDRREYVLRFREMERPPITWGILVGELIHNLHSALEQAVYQLTLRCNGVPMSGTGFPIYWDSAKYSERTKAGNPTRKSGLWKIRGISPDARTIIESVQPYHTKAEDRENDPMWLLHEFWNQDKHRVPVLANASVLTSSIGVRNPPTTGFNSRLMSGPQKDSAVVGRVTFKAPAPSKVRVHGDFAFQVVLEDVRDTSASAQEVMRSIFDKTNNVLNSLLLRI